MRIHAEPGQQQRPGQRNVGGPRQGWFDLCLHSGPLRHHLCPAFNLLVTLLLKVVLRERMQGGVEGLRKCGQRGCCPGSISFNASVKSSPAPQASKPPPSPCTLLRDIAGHPLPIPPTYSPTPASHFLWPRLSSPSAAKAKGSQALASHFLSLGYRSPTPPPLSVLPYLLVSPTLSL